MKNIPIRYNLRNLWQRKGRNAMVMFGIALVVAIFMMMMAMADGLLISWQAGGAKDNIAVLQKGALYLEFSFIPKHFLNVIKYIPQVKQKDGMSLASPESLISTWIKKENENKEQPLLVRGINPIAFEVHNRIKIVTGEKPKNGRKIVIGKAVPFRLEAKLGLGDKVIMFGKDWEIVGIFESPGSALESEIWVDLDDLLLVADRDVYSGVTLKVNHISNLKTACEVLNNNKQISVRALPEKEYYAETSSMFSGMKGIGLLITLVAAIGAILGGMNTMFTAVAGRIREIGILRALGFSESKIMTSFVIESLIISLLGGAIGILLALPINGAPLPIMAYVFQFKITLKTILQGIGLAIILGIFGGYLPARWGAKLKVIEAIRHT